jgi:hypothetical protein
MVYEANSAVFKLFVYSTSSSTPMQAFSEQYKTKQCLLFWKTGVSFAHQPGQLSQ